MTANTRRVIALGLALLAPPTSISPQQRGMAPQQPSAMGQPQRGMAPQQPGPGGNPVAPLIEMRRELDLTSRQLVQLDSLERSYLQRNRPFQEQLRALVNPLSPDPRQQPGDDQQRAMRARNDSMQTLRREIQRNDSTVHARAMAVLTDSQRTQVLVREAEQRGFAEGFAAAQGQRGMGQGGPPGAGRMGAPPQGGGGQGQQPPQPPAGQTGRGGGMQGMQGGGMQGMQGGGMQGMQGSQQQGGGGGR